MSTAIGETMYQVEVTEDERAALIRVIRGWEADGPGDDLTAFVVGECIHELRSIRDRLRPVGSEGRD